MTSRTTLLALRYTAAIIILSCVFLKAPKVFSAAPTTINGGIAVAGTYTNTSLPNNYFVLGENDTSGNTYTITINYQCYNAPLKISLSDTDAHAGVTITPSPSNPTDCANKINSGNEIDSGSATYTIKVNAGLAPGQTTPYQSTGNGGWDEGYEADSGLYDVPLVLSGVERDSGDGGVVNYSATVSGGNSSTELSFTGDGIPHQYTNDGTQGFGGLGATIFGTPFSASSATFSPDAYNFAIPCSYTSGSIYLDWSGADDGDSTIQPNSDNLGFTITDVTQGWSKTFNTSSKDTYTDPSGKVTTSNQSGDNYFGPSSNSNIYQQDLTSIGGPVQEGDHFVWQWFGLAHNNEMGIGVPYNRLQFDTGDKCWKLKGDSEVQVGSTISTSTTSLQLGQTADFSHQVKDTGVDTANYRWWIEGEYKVNGTAETASNGTDWTNYDCGSINNGTNKCPSSPGCLPINNYNNNNTCGNENQTETSVSPGGTEPTLGLGTTAEVAYKFPTGANTGDEYCERISFTNGTGPNDTTIHNSSPVCVTAASSCSPCSSANGCTDNCPDPDTNSCFTSTVNNGTYNGEPQIQVIYIASTYNGGASTQPVVPRFNGSGLAYYTANTYNWYGSPGWYYVGPNSSQSFDYYPDGTGVASLTYKFYFDPTAGTSGAYEPEPGTPSVSTESCYSAKCTVTAIADTNGDAYQSAAFPFMQNGQPYTATVEVQNQGPFSLDNPLLSPPIGSNYLDEDGPDFGLVGAGGNTPTYDYPSGDSYYPYGGPSLDYPGDVGDTVDIPEPLTAGPGAEYDTPTFTPYYPSFYLPGYGYTSGFNLGSSCSWPPIDVYEQFTLTPNSCEELTQNSGSCVQGGDDESAQWFNYDTSVTNQDATNVAVNADTSAQDEEFPNGTPPANVYANQPNGTYTYAGGTTTTTSGSHNITSESAGDEYCAIQTIYNYNTGWVGAGGPSDIMDTNTLPSTGLYNEHCNNIYNEPYFKAYGQGVVAGGEFSDLTPSPSSCNQGGELSSWNGDSGTYPADDGAGSELSNLALIDPSNPAVPGIVGYTSNMTQSVSSSGYGLSFANSGANEGTGSPPSGVYGGNFDYCNYFDDVKPLINSTVGTPNPNISTIDGNWPAGVTQQSFTYNSPTVITGGHLSAGHNLSIFVNGDVYIAPGAENGIIYANPESGNWAPTGPSNALNAPSMVIHATGNIYIDPGVTELDGIYIAEKTSSSPLATGGTIYTCGQQLSPTSFSPYTQVNLYNCNNQLNVYGSFIADQVNLMRTSGSVRDAKNYEEVPSEGYNGTSHTCNNAGTGNSAVCASEVFNFSPELYLSDPAVLPTNGGGIQYDSITSLPPIL